MADCEWMFGDAASGPLGFNELAHLSPLRWSGALTFPKAISDLEEVLSNGSRPILVKVPSGFATPSKRFETTQTALEFLKKANPAEHRRRQKKNEQTMEAVKVAMEAKDAAVSEAAAISEEVTSQEATLSTAQAEAETAANVAKEATLAVQSVQSEGKCEWMFGDAGKGLLGFKVAKLNPLRWSGKLSFMEGSRQLQETQQQTEGATRRIVVRVPPGTAGEEKHFNNCSGAISYLDGLCPIVNKAREERDAANTAHKAAAANVTEVEAVLAESRKKLEVFTMTVSESEAGLESANEHAAQAKAELEELSSIH